MTYFLISFKTVTWCNGPLRYLNPPGPITALASHPGSGNTWVRYLIQHVTGYSTGAIYNDNALKKFCSVLVYLENGHITKVRSGLQKQRGDYSKK